MSGSTPDPVAEADLLAAEYVLGTLDAADRAALERESDSNPAMREAIAAWERRLSPLAAISRAVSPPASLWSRIESSAWGRDMSGVAGGAAPRTSMAAPDPARRRVRFWQGGTAAGFALAAALAGFAVLRPLAPPLAPPPPPRPLVTALLPLTRPGASVFLVETTPGGGLAVTPVGTVHVAPDRTLELWLLPSGAKVPKALGLLPSSGVRLAAGSLPAGISAQILVSLEPRGGSPTGLPTGPVLFGGSI